VEPPTNPNGSGDNALVRTLLPGERMKPRTDTELPSIADAQLAGATGGNTGDTSGSTNPPPATCAYTDGRRHSRTLCPNGPGK